MEQTIMCAHCGCLTEFKVYTAERDGNKMENVVPVDKHGEYLCQRCTDIAIEKRLPNFAFIPATQYTIMQSMKFMGGMLMRAEDIIEQYRREALLEDDDELLDTIAIWLSEYREFKGSAGSVH